MRSIPIRIAALLFVFAGGFLFVESASAHAKYQRSEPGDGARVSTPPARVDIWFAQELFRRQGDNAIQVFGSGGQPVQVGELQIDNDDRKHMWVQLPSGLAPGKYRVDWNNVSAEDGDPDKGSFSFTYDPEAVITDAPMGLTTPTGPAGAEPVTSQASPMPSVATAPLSVPSPTSPLTKPASKGGGCLPGMLPIGGFAGTALILHRRRSMHP